MLISSLFPGTVLASIANIDFVKRRESVEQLFEDGTLSFLSIASIRHGFRIINSLTMRAIRRYDGAWFYIVMDNFERYHFC